MRVILPTHTQRTLNYPPMPATHWLTHPDGMVHQQSGQVYTARTLLSRLLEVQRTAQNLQEQVDGLNLKVQSLSAQNRTLLDMRPPETPPATASEPTPPASILAEAQEIVQQGARAADYGDSNRNLLRIGQMMALIATDEEWEELEAHRWPGSLVAKTLMAMKLVRHAHRPKHDNLVDLCGYAELLHRWESPAYHNALAQQQGEQWDREIEERESHENF
jgi:hypothetical protein